MPEEINKKLPYLKRDEVRTMEKDIAELRETEAEKTREKIVQIKTGGEITEEAERIEQSKKAAEERERAEAEARKKLAQNEALRRARQNAELLAGKTEEETAERKKESLRTQLRETQLREEEERRKFLERVARQMGEEKPTPPLPAEVPQSGTKEGLPADLPAEASTGAKAGVSGAKERPTPVPPPVLPPAPPIPPAPVIPPKPAAPKILTAPPAPPAISAPTLLKKPFKIPLPSIRLPSIKIPSIKIPKPKLPSIRLPKFQLPKVQLPKVNGYFPKKPSLFEKIWIRVIVSLFVLAILATIITFWYWYLIVRAPAPTLPAPPAPIQETAPLPLIPTEKVITIEIASSEELPNKLSQALKENLGENKFTRILIKSVPKNRFLGLKEFFEVFQVQTPENFYNNLNDDFTLFIFSSLPAENRLGFVARTENPAVLRSILESWEKTLEKDTDNLFVILGKKGAKSPFFQKFAYKNTAIHYLSFSEENFGICWAIIDNYFIFTSSGESIIKTIDKIKE